MQQKHKCSNTPYILISLQSYNCFFPPSFSKNKRVPSLENHIKINRLINVQWTNEQWMKKVLIMLL